MANATSADTSYISQTSGLKTKDYFGYALGDVAGCLVFSLVTTLLQKYYTDILHLSPLFIMIMMIVARVWDAVNDPIMGRIADTRRPTKWGRYRPWMLYVSVPLGLSAILMFVWWPNINNIAAMVLSIVTYIGFGMVYTVHQIPYGSLASVVTTDERERSKLSVWRSAGAALGSMPVILIASFCYKNRVDSNGNVVTNPTTGAVVKDMQYWPVLIGVIVLSVISSLLLLLAFKLNHERTVPTEAPKKEKGATKRVIKTLLSNRAFLSLSIASMLLLAGQMFIQSYYTYLFNDFFLGMNWMNIASMACTYGPMAVFMFFAGKLNRKVGKKESCAAGATLAAVANLALFFCQGLMPGAWWLFLLLCFVSGCGLALFCLQVWSLATDAIDEIEIKTGQKEDGSAYSTFLFFRKMGQVIAAVAINGALLGMNYETDPLKVQSAATLQAMYIMASIIPAVLFGGMALCLWFWYPIDKKRLAALQIEKEAKLKEQIESNKITILPSQDSGK
jgi:GPH family glycoside/pentoside/hexuronide:cation symporter